MTSNSDLDRHSAAPPSFRARLALTLIGLAMIPLLILGGLSMALLRDASQNQAAARLYTTASYRQAQLERWIDGLDATLYKLATADPALLDALRQRFADKPLIESTEKGFQAALSPDGFDELMLISWDDRVLTSTNNERQTSPERFCGPKIICAFGPFRDGERTVLGLQYPLVDDGSQQVGFIIGLADTHPLDSILGSRTGLGGSGLAYLVGPDGDLLWLPGFGPAPQKQVAFPTLERAVLPSAPMTYSGALGADVQGIATSIVRLNAWLIVEQSLSEIFQPASSLPLIILALIALTLAGIIAASRVFARPVAVLTGRNARLDAALDNARNADQLKSRTIANMSHELRTPINAILNFSGFLLDGLFGALTGDQSELVRQMHASSQHLLDLINDLLDMSKIEAGEMRLFVTEFDPAPVFDQAIATMRSLTLSKPITINVDLPRTWPTVRGDRRRVLQILLNLVSNAAKFTDEGAITLRVHVYAMRLEVRIEDSGAGIDPADAPNLFEPFRQGYNALLLEKGGTGLGLPLSRIFARMHGGDLDYLPGEHGGAVFILWIPLDPIAYEQKKIDAPPVLKV